MIEKFGAKMMVIVDTSFNPIQTLNQEEMRCLDY